MCFRLSISRTIRSVEQAIRYAATSAAIDLDVLRCRQPRPIYPACVIKGGTAHLLSVQSRQARHAGLDIPITGHILYPLPLSIPEVSTGVAHEKRKEKLLDRVRRVRGQIEAVERALKDEKGCATVLHLIVGARGAMNSLMTELIEEHIRLHVVDPINGTERARGAEELIEAVQTYLK